MRGIDVFGLVSERIAHEEPRIRARAALTMLAGSIFTAIDGALGTAEDVFAHPAVELVLGA